MRRLGSEDASPWYVNTGCSLHTESEVAYAPTLLFFDVPGEGIPCRVLPATTGDGRNRKVNGSRRPSNATKYLLSCTMLDPVQDP
jgi:hypothetical protein